MTSPYTFSEALALVESTIDDTALVTNFVANTSTVPPGVAMIGADVNALLNLGLYYGQVAGDGINVFAEHFQALILETLAAATLAAAIVGNIENAIQIGSGTAGHAAAATGNPTASEVLAQVQQQSATALAALNTAFTDINDTTKIPPFNTTAGIEAQFVGGQIYFSKIWTRS